MVTFRKCQNKIIEGFNDKNWLGVNILKFDRSYLNRYVDSRCLIRLIYEKGEAIGRLKRTVHNASKVIHIMSTTIFGMVQDLHNLEK